MEYVQLDPWQKKALDCKGHMLLCTGRQSGKTFLMARKAASYMLNHENCRIIVVSLTEDQAELMIIMVLDYLEKNHLSQIEEKKKQPTKTRIFLKNGAMILARPCGNTGDAVRGFTGDVLILDEASRMPEFAFIAAKPTLLTTGGKIWMCSTPFGKSGYFYESFINKHKRFTVIHTNSEEVMKKREITETWTQQRRDGALRTLEEEKKDMSKLQYAQEYLGEFIDELRQFFSDELINETLSLKRHPAIIPNRNYYLGVDIARMGEDKGTFEIIDQIDENHLQQVENIVTKKKYTTETYDKIVELQRIWNFEKIGIDAGSGSLGVGILDFLLRNEETKRNTIALNNRAVLQDYKTDKKGRLMKEAMYIQMQMLMEQGKLKLLNEPDIRLSLKSVQYEYVMQEGLPTKIRIFGNDTHIAEGLIRACWLANQKSLNIRISWM